MFFTKRTLPVLPARLSPHNQTPGHNNNTFCKDRLPRPNSYVDSSTKNLDPDSACHSIPISIAVPSQYVTSVTSINGNNPRDLELFWNQCESGTLTQPLKAHVWSQRRHVTSNTSNTPHSLGKDGGYLGNSTRLSPRIICQKHVLGSGLRWRVRAFSTNLKYSPEEDNGSVTKNTYLSNFYSSAQGTKIRDHLKDWQQQHEKLSATHRGAFDTSVIGTVGATQNPISQSGVDDTLNSIDQDDLPLEENHQYDEEPAEPLSESLDKNNFLRKGDVVSLRTNGENVLAVYLRQLDEQAQFYTISGKWVNRMEFRINFVVPRMISANQLNPILPYLPAEPVPRTSLDRLNMIDSSAPREAGAMIIAELNHFHRSATQIILKNVNQLNHAFDTVAHPTEISIATLEEITMKVLQIADLSELTYPALWAVYKTIAGNENFHVGSFHGREFPQIHVVSKKYAEELVRIRTWAREYQEQMITNVTGIESAPVEDNIINPFPGFLAKARALIAYSRKSRTVTKNGRVGPIQSDIEPAPLKVSKFNRNEQMIARFICEWSCHQFGVAKLTMPVILPMVLRATGMYDGFELDKSTAFVFSQEIGLLPSWTNKDCHNSMLPLQGYRDIMHKFRPATRYSKPVESFSDMTDSMAHFRKDWADMPVFCIDNSHVQDIDDGVSLEEIQGDASAYWVHIHTANPSAFIQPTSRSGQIAEELVASRYLIHERCPMLPGVLTETCFSLAKGRPCITFSAKVTSDGDIVETKISHGIIHNVKFITPAQLRRELHPERTQAPSLTIVVGRREVDSGSSCNPTRQNSETECAAVPEYILPSDLKILHKLSELGARRLRRRIQAGAITYPGRLKPQVSVDMGTTSVKIEGNHRFEPNEPIISLTTESFDPYQASLNDWTSDKMVENLMILAGEIAASWCIKRNIPVMYIGTLRNPEPPESPELYRQKFFDLIPNENSFARVPIIIRYIKLLGSSIFGPVPTEHIPLGVSAYCRVTSPLRRYGDLLNHWQIEAAIRQESATGSSLIGGTDENCLPFSFSRIKAMGPRILHYERLLRMLGTRSESHWTLQLLFRAFYFNEATLPLTLNVFILSTQTGNQALRFAWSIEIGFICDVPENEATSKQGGVFQGDIWEAKIKEIDCYDRRVRMEPIRLVSREVTQLFSHA